MMEFYNNNGESGNLSLQDMIECDIRSSFGEQMTNSEGLNTHNHNLDNHIPTSMDFNVNGLGNVTANGTHLTQNSDSTKLQDLSWLQNVDVATIQQLVQPENTDPNLLVNPQTGMPIQQQQSVQNQTSQNQVTVSLAQPQGHNQVHYVNVPSSPLRQVQTPQSFSPQRPQQQPSPMQHVQNLQQVAFQNSASQHVQQQQNNQLLTNNNQISSHQEDNLSKVYPKPVYSYSCLIALALKNSETGCLPVSEIYLFMTENFPYFKTAPGGWKNSVRHNLSLNKCFEKIENPKSNGQTRKGCLWGMNPAKVEKMEEEIAKWRKKDPIAIKRSMSRPENLELYERAQPGSNRSNSPKPPPVSQSQVIEITPHKPVESIAIKDEKIGNNLTSEELSMLDHSLNLDPALSEIALENGIWDDLNSDGLNLDDIPISTSPINFSFASAQLRASPVSMQSNSHGSSKLSLTGIQGNYLYADQSVVSASMTQSPTPGAYQVSRTVAATT